MSFIDNRKLLKKTDLKRLKDITFSHHSRMLSMACSEEKIRFTLMVNLHDFLKPFKGDIHKSMKFIPNIAVCIRRSFNH